jgi:hypothetical protein
MSPQRYLSDIRMVVCTRQLLDQLPVPSLASRGVATEIRRRHEQPWQNRTIYNANAIPAAPKLQERRRNEVLSVLSRLSEATCVPKHAVAMQIEQPAEGRAIPLEAA